MEVSSSSRRIEKFSRGPGTISLKEFKAIFSTVVCKLEVKYGINYIEAFAFKQLANYVHYEALNVYEQHFPKILGITQIPNPTCATTIAITFQATIVHHGTVPNNLDPVPTLIILSPQQLIIVIINIPPTIDATTFGEFFRVLELEFLVKSFEKNLQLATFS
jgi:hypothetical protein